MDNSMQNRPAIKYVLRSMTFILVHITNAKSNPMY